MEKILIYFFHTASAMRIMHGTRFR